MPVKQSMAETTNEEGWLFNHPRYEANWNQLLDDKPSNLYVPTVSADKIRIACQII